MKTRPLQVQILLLLMTCIFFSASIMLLKQLYEKESLSDFIVVEASTELPEPEPDPILVAIEEMSVEEKVGQMFIGGYHNSDYLNQQINLIQNQHFGGIILMRENVESHSKTSSTITTLKEVEKTLENPLFISIDEEGGVVTRLYNQMPRQDPQGTIKSPQDAYVIAHTKGAYLNKIGVNVNFAPVMDHINDRYSFLYDRVFHSDMKGISDISAEMLRGYDENDVIAVPKHYPGHPDTASDSHFNLPSSIVNETQFDQYCRQFRILIDQHDPKMIMTGHVMFPNIDPNYPSTLSKKIMTEKLRKEYGYEGVIITDDMNMGALKYKHKFPDSAVLAVEAGNDILIYITEPRFQQVAYETVLKAVKTGRISEERIDESVYRILKLKEEL